MKLFLFLMFIIILKTNNAVKQKQTKNFNRWTPKVDYLNIKEEDIQVSKVDKNFIESSNFHGKNFPPSWVEDVCDDVDPSDVICSGLFQRYHQEYSIEGDIMLAGLFPIHQGDGCLDLEDMGSIQRMEAMAYSVKMFNSWPSFMKNFTLGFRIFDTCNSQSVALSRTLSVLPHCTNCTHYPICFPECPVIVSGIVGPESSSNTLLAAHAANLALTPIISHFATSLELKDPAIFPTLYTTVPSDDYQISAMLDVLEHFGWTYFSFVHTDDRYGKDALDYIQNKIVDMCLAAIIQVSNTGSNSSYNQVIEKLLEYKEQSDANVVIVFTDGNSANKLFKAVERYGAIGEFVWIGSEGWGVSMNDISSMLHVAQGAVTFTPHTEINEDFDEYFQELPINHTQNPWWADIWREHFGCSWALNITKNETCFQYSHINISNGYVPDSTVSLVIDAVTAFAYSISDYVNNTDDSLLYDENGKVRVPPWKLWEHIQKNFFPESSAKQFLSLGDSVARYDISNLQFVNGSYKYVSVGNWHSNGTTVHQRLNLNESLIQWPGYKEITPSSYCSKYCQDGEVRVLLKISCCWDCQKCTDDAIVVNKTRCHVCDDFYWPNDDFSQCKELELQYLKWYAPEVIILVTLASLVLFMAVLTSIYLIWHRNERLVKASGKELMSVIMVGVIFQASMVFFILAKPRPYTCFMYRFMFGLDLTVSYSAIVVKSNRIYRIFNKGLKSPKAPLWIKTYQQLLTVSVMILFQVAIVTSLCIFYPPQVSKIQPSPGVAEITCAVKDEITVLLPLAYNLLLIMPCIYYSFKTRSLPANFNESRFIAFTVCTTLVVWVAFIPIYLTVGTSGSASSAIHMEILSIVELMSSFNTLACLFFPKLYALMCVPSESWNATSWYKKTSNLPVRCRNCGYNSMKPTGARSPMVVPLPRRSMSVIARGDVANLVKSRRRTSSLGGLAKSKENVPENTYPHQILINGRSNDLQLRPLSLSVPDLQLVEIEPKPPSVKRSKTDFFRRSKRGEKKKSVEINVTDDNNTLKLEENGKTTTNQKPSSIKRRRKSSINPIDQVIKWGSSLEIPYIDSPRLSPKMNHSSKGRVRLEPLTFDNEGNHHPNQIPGSPERHLTKDPLTTGILKEKTMEKLKNGILKEKTSDTLRKNRNQKEKTSDSLRIPNQREKTTDNLNKTFFETNSNVVGNGLHVEREKTMDIKREGSYLTVPRENSFPDIPRARVVTYSMATYKNPKK